MNKKLCKLLINLSILIIIISYIGNYINLDKEVISVFRSEYLEGDSIQYKRLNSGTDLVPNSMDINVMRNNTYNLQRAIDNVSDSGGGIVYIPRGIFYFAQGGISSSDYQEAYVIRCRNNVHLIGAGVEEKTGYATVLKPVYSNTSGRGSLDMFYFNNYRDTKFLENYSYPSLQQVRDVTYYDVIENREKLLSNQSVYLKNADFSNFIIDAENVHGGTYNTTGKGFMINLYANCDWDNIVIRNTDATGFGMDCPINSTIKNSMAINCGKAATDTSNGGSGFGIGTGLSNYESITISDCVSLNNKKYGFFFENQSRYRDDVYKASDSFGFIVRDCTAGGNLYDFGGLKSNDLIYERVKSITGNSSYKYNGNVVNINSSHNKRSVNFSLYSVNTLLVNSDLSSNITNLGSYPTEVRWAIDNGYIMPESYFSFNSRRLLSREEAISILYRYNQMKGSVAVKNTTKQQNDTLDELKRVAGFNDIEISDLKFENDNMDSILWGVNNNILSHDTTFRGNDYATRAQFFVMLYRMAGCPNYRNTSIPFKDVPSNAWYIDAVKWAYATGITKGKDKTSFDGGSAITSSEAAIALYRYNNSKYNSYIVSYGLISKNANTNIISYNASSLPVTIRNPYKDGYTFEGWSGSNISSSTTSLKLTKNTTGNLVFIANWEKVLSNVSINSYPIKTEYSVGESLDITGLSLKLDYEDDSVDYYIPTLNSNIKFTSRGTKTINLVYKGHKITFKVVVK